MDYTNLPKQTFADLIALRQAVVALINVLPDEEKELSHRCEPEKLHYDKW